MLHCRSMAQNRPPTHERFYVSCKSEQDRLMAFIADEPPSTLDRVRVWIEDILVEGPDDHEVEVISLKDRHRRIGGLRLVREKLNEKGKWSALPGFFQINLYHVQSCDSTTTE